MEEKRDLPALYHVEKETLANVGLSRQNLNFVIKLFEYGFNHIGEAYRNSRISRTKKTTEAGKKKDIAKGKALLKEEDVRAAIKIITKDVLTPLRDQLEFRVVQFLENRAFWDPRIFFTNNFEAKCLDEIPEEFRTVIDGIKVDYKGKDATQKIIIYELASREKAIKQLMEWMQAAQLPAESDPNKIANKRQEIDGVMDLINRSKGKVTLTRRTEEISVDEDKKDGESK